MLRRLIALVVFFITVYIADRARQGDFGMLSPAVTLICAVVIIVALAGILFKLPFARRYPPEGFGMSRSIGVGLGHIGIFIFAVIPLFIAGKGVYTGVLQALDSGPDVTFASSPIKFIGILFLWLAVSLVIFWLLVKAMRANADQADKDQ